MLHIVEHDLFEVTTLLTVRERQCKWPLYQLEDDIQVCGKEALIGQPYCSCHCHMAYTNFGVKK